jgi:O-antigen chain-terminating methyltransferase
LSAPADELAAILEQIRDRVRERHASGSSIGPLPDLLPILHARDAAQGKVASIGRVNPRAGGIVNNLIQGIKQLVARALDWHVREQVEFNQAAVTALEAILQALEENNRMLRKLAPVEGEIRDTIAHWIAWRSEWERKLAANETQFLRGVADLQSAFQHRVTLLEANHREMIAAQHRNFEAALDRRAIDIQKQFWSDMERVREEYQTLIHHELRLLRQKITAGAESGAGPWPAAGSQPATPDANYDNWTFAEKFRGPKDHVKKTQNFYLEHFKGRKRIIDIGCGRGEFLELLRDNGVPAKGVDSDADNVAHCQANGLDVARGDLFTFLESEPEGSLDGVFCCQVIEHLPRMRVPELVRLVQSRLKRGGLFAVETPNPECLAIFATHFYLDPTHQHPIPPDLLAFYFVEAGFELKVHRFAPAVETMPELAALPEDLRNRFFGALDYAVLGIRI